MARPPPWLSPRAIDTAWTARGGVTEYRHLIAGGKGIATIYTRRSDATNSTYYVQSDHLGSPELVTDSAGTVIVRLSFGAYGERRDKDGDGPISPADLIAIGNVFRHGFTGHEHLDAVGLIHMNGRVYEPVAARFLEVDPIVQLGSSQSPNTFAYVWNNPLTLIDPSGLDGCDPNSRSCVPVFDCSYGRDHCFQIGWLNGFPSSPYYSLSPVATKLGYVLGGNNFDGRSGPPKLGDVVGGAAESALRFAFAIFDAICSVPAIGVGGQLQFSSGFWGLFGFEGQVSLTFTSHLQFIWTQTAGGVTGVNSGLILSGGPQVAMLPRDADTGFSRISSLGGEILVTGGDGFGVALSKSTDDSEFVYSGMQKGSWAAGGGIVSGVNYQSGLAIASPSLCAQGN